MTFVSMQPAELTQCRTSLAHLSGPHPGPSTPSWFSVPSEPQALRMGAVWVCYSCLSPQKVYRAAGFGFSGLPAANCNRTGCKPTFSQTFSISRSCFQAAPPSSLPSSLLGCFSVFRWVRRLSSYSSTYPSLLLSFLVSPESCTKP